MKDRLGVDQYRHACTGDTALEVFRETYGDNVLWAGLGSSFTFPE